MAIILGPEDMKNLKIVYDLIMDNILKVPEEIYKSEKFGALAISAIINAACDYANILGVDQEKLHKMVKQIWDAKYNKSNGVLN